jgi:RND family efflux transporter MFP subunit
MKISSISILTVLAVLVYSCGGKEQTNLDKLMAQRDSLRTEQSAILNQIAALDAQITALDTTKKLMQVTAMQIERSTFEHYFDIYGNVEADQNVQLYSEVGGEVLSIPVKEGDRVTQGQLLVKVDDEILRKNVEQVETQLRLANDVFTRQERLWKKNIGSEMQYLEAKNTKESLEKQLASMQAQPNKAQITAPFSGVVDEVFTKVGEMAGPGMPLIRLVNVSDVYIKADVSEKYLARVKTGTDVRVKFPDLGLSVDTTISLTGQFINPLNRTFSVRVELDNTNKVLKPNLLAVLQIKDFEQDSAVVVPSNLIQQSAKGDEFVYVLEQSNGKAKVNRVAVETGISYNNQTHVKSGLAGNEWLVKDGARSVKDGQEVELAKD